jgi:predicted amidohydrolase
MKREIKVAAIQMRNITGESKKTKDQAIAKKMKIERALELIEKAAKDKAKIILLGELFEVDYDIFYEKDFDHFKLAEPVPGPITNAVGEIAKKNNIYVIVPMFEKAAPGIYYNSAPTIGPDGSVVSNFRKTHVAGVRVLEKLYFRAGQEYKVLTTEFEPYAKFGTIICYDRRFSETARMLAIQGTEIMFCPTAAPGYAGGLNWDIVNQARALDNQMFAVYSNRVGKAIDKTYFGDSMIVNPKGEVIDRAGEKPDFILSATIDLEEVDRERINRPILRDLRPELYMQYYKKPKYDELL